MTCTPQSISQVNSHFSSLSLAPIHRKAVFRFYLCFEGRSTHTVLYTLLLVKSLSMLPSPVASGHCLSEGTKGCGGQVSFYLLAQTKHRGALRYTRLRLQVFEDASHRSADFFCMDLRAKILDTSAIWWQ